MKQQSWEESEKRKSEKKEDQRRERERKEDQSAQIVEKSRDTVVLHRFGAVC